MPRTSAKSIPSTRHGILLCVFRTDFWDSLIAVSKVRWVSFLEFLHAVSLNAIRWKSPTTMVFGVVEFCNAWHDLLYWKLCYLHYLYCLSFFFSIWIQGRQLGQMVSFMEGTVQIWRGFGGSVLFIWSHDSNLLTSCHCTLRMTIILVWCRSGLWWILHLLRNFWLLNFVWCVRGYAYLGNSLGGKKIPESYITNYYLVSVFLEWPKPDFLCTKVSLPFSVYYYFEMHNTGGVGWVT